MQHKKVELKLNEESRFIGITMGDPGGIGPEIAIKSVKHFIENEAEYIKPIIFGSFENIEYTSQNIIKTDIPINLIKLDSFIDYAYQTGKINVIDLASKSYAQVKYGNVNHTYAKDVEKFIETAVDFSIKEKILGFATAPINKDMMLKGGARFGGHTELLGYLAGSDDFAMLFYSDKLIAILSTIHIPISEVPVKITKNLLRKIIKISIEWLKKDLGKNSPNIAVLGLNPHAGENGRIGNEEKEIIVPVIEEFKNYKENIAGPFPADSFFAEKYKKFDLIVAMYHDQALIPFKLLSFHKGVNVTAGLKFIRTSPVHGTAYDIAGKNKADCGSMIESIKLVGRISENRKRWKER